MSEHIYSPSELNREIKLHLEAGFPRLLVEAEISNLARPASGHLYFSLKDDRAQVRCALFRSSASRVSMRLENGMKVLARGRISLYEPRGEYQFIVDHVQDAGEGLLQRQFEELKRKLDREGLFDPAHKQALAPYPARIGLITSPSGAAVRDLLHVLERRWPLARVRIYPVRVQGKEAPDEICRAILSANEHGWAETLIVGRGGGSLEDLAAFNDESVAREVFKSVIPVVSAVGHETDFSICDFVADLRAPTPSAAAELASPDQVVLKTSFSRSLRQLERRVRDRLQQGVQGLDHLAHRLQQRHPASHLAEQSKQLRMLENSLARNMKRSLNEQSLALTSLSRRLAPHRPDRKIRELGERLGVLGKSLERQASIAIRSRRDELGRLARTLNAVSPLETIDRGYAVVTGARSGEVISSVSKVNTGDRITARLKDGELDCSVEAIR